MTERKIIDEHPVSTSTRQEFSRGYYLRAKQKRTTTTKTTRNEKKLKREEKAKERGKGGKVNEILRNEPTADQTTNDVREQDREKRQPGFFARSFSAAVSFSP